MIHPQAFVAAQAANCAREQGKFWEYHDKLFANQSALQPEFLKKYAADTGLDTAKFNQCLDTSKYEARVQEALGAGGRLGITSTPTLFVNGRMINGAQPIEVFETAIDDELARGREIVDRNCVRRSAPRPRRSRQTCPESVSASRKFPSAILSERKTSQSRTTIARGRRLIAPP